MTKIYLKHITKSFKSSNGNSKLIISDLNLEISSSMFITIIGPNGCGKTTLLNIIAGIIKPDDGMVKIETDSGKNPIIGYVWQDYRASLLPWLDVADNISFPLRILGRKRKERREMAFKILSDFNTSFSPNQKIYQLSGGQQQLVCILRSAISRPDIFLFDEPLSALDQPTSWSMAFHIEKIWMEQKVPMIFVSHDIDEAILLADKILLMGRNGGKIEQTIINDLPRPRNVKMLTSSKHIYCREQVIDFLTQNGAIKDQLLEKKMKLSKFTS